MSNKLPRSASSANWTQQEMKKIRKLLKEPGDEAARKLLNDLLNKGVRPEQPEDEEGEDTEESAEEEVGNGVKGERKPRAPQRKPGADRNYPTQLEEQVRAARRHQRHFSKITEQISHEQSCGVLEVLSAKRQTSAEYTPTLKNIKPAIAQDTRVMAWRRTSGMRAIIVLKDDDNAQQVIDFVKSHIAKEGLPAFIQRCQGRSRGSLQLPAVQAFKAATQVLSQAGEDASARLVTDWPREWQDPGLQVLHNGEVLIQTAVDEDETHYLVCLPERWRSFPKVDTERVLASLTEKLERLCNTWPWEISFGIVNSKKVPFKPWNRMAKRNTSTASGAGRTAASAANADETMRD